jgi:hypothetical protein
MTALEMLQTLKSNRHAMLWIDPIARTANFHDGEYGQDVAYNDALLVRPDPAITAEPHMHGEFLYAN